MTIDSGVTPLGSRPVPPNSNADRSMFVWVSSAPDNVLATDQNQQDLINLCGTRGVNVLYLSIYTYIGGSNWTTEHVDRMAQFVDAAHRSGIRVYALSGDVGWGQYGEWVMRKIVKPIVDFGNVSGIRFDGMVYDVEYWTNSSAYPPDVHCPGLCDLILQTKQRSDWSLGVGVFSAFFLKDNSGTRASLTYHGKNAQDGEHLMDVSDFVVVGAYRDTAFYNPSNGHNGQVELFQPWYDYASQAGKNFGLVCGSEVSNVSPDYITYFGQGLAYMESQHSLISEHFKQYTNMSFSGQSIHNYDNYKIME